MKGFLYGQTEYYLLHNAIHLDDYIQSAVHHHFTFLSITDPNLYGCYKFYQSCIKHHIKPIIGMELAYIDEDGFQTKFLAYAKNKEGFQNLIKISTNISTQTGQTGYDFLKTHAQNIAIIVVYDESILERLFVSKAYLELEAKLNEYEEAFEFYIGYSFTNRLDRLKSNQEFKEYAELKGYSCLPIHNCRYLKEKDDIIYDALIKIAGEKNPMNDYHDYSFDCNPYMTKELEDFINHIDLNLFDEKIYLPKYPNTKGASALEFLTALCYKGLNKRLLKQPPLIYENRLKYELSVIDKMGYCDYFLIVWDFILWAKKKGILVGPGRGSAAGSLVAYCLGITDIDPLKYDLLFERFLNPERISMPDIDTDFPDDHRDEVIQYVKDLYGDKHVCSISAYNTFLMRSAIRDLGRIMKIESHRLDEFIKLVDSQSDFNSLLTQFADRKDIYEFLYIIHGLEGLPRHISTHAAGIIISSLPLDDIIPLQTGINGLYQSQLEANDLENIGLLKMDFLGIRNLSIIDSVIQQIPQFTIKDLRNIPLNDPMTFNLLKKADTLGVFQLESLGIRRVLTNLQCESFDDLVAVLALYRPGPMDNIDEYIARKHGKPFQYAHPILEPVLRSTYGIIVYQEQIMLIAQSFAGFSLGQADLLRRAISKKNESTLEKLQDQFIAGAIQKGYSQNIALDIYRYILKFANYGFNKSHSVAYGLLAYQMAYLKAHYFNIFISKILNNVIGSVHTMVDYINYAKTHHVKTYKPNVNISTTIFEVNQAGMFMPLQAIHSIGETTAREIVAERNKNGLYKNFSDFKKRIKISTSCLEALIYAGALDGFGMTKKQMIESKESYHEIFAKHLEDRIEDHSEYEFKYLRQKELEFLGFNLSYDLFKNIQSLHQKWHVGWIAKNRNSGIVSFETIQSITTKKQDKMLVGSINDGQSIYRFVVFPSTLQAIPFKLDSNTLYLIQYKAQFDQVTNEDKIIIKKVMQV